MRKEKIMAIQRRRMLTAALGGAFSASVLTAGRVDAAPAPVFEKPTADNPIIACYNENPLGLSAAARKAVADSAAVANRYPFVRCEVLRKACAQLIGGKPEGQSCNGRTDLQRRPNGSCAQQYSRHQGQDGTELVDGYSCDEGRGR